MEPELKTILRNIHNQPGNRRIQHLSITKLWSELKEPVQELYKHVIDESDLAKLILEQEKRSLQDIFEKHSFNGENAIDLLLQVGKDISFQFKELTLTITLDIHRYYPEIYEQYLENRLDFIFTKIKNNLEHGIRQGVYRSDLSTELLARLYISRLIDLHNPLLFPPGKFSFNIVFDVMIDNFIRGIATEQGIKHYESRIKTMEFVMN